MSQEQNQQEQNTQETLCNVTVSASIAMNEQVSQAGNRFTLPDGRHIAVWLLPELIDERVEGKETYTDISWEEAEALGIHLNEYLETEINEQ